MTSHVTREFVNCFNRLPKRIQAQARKNYKRWSQDPSHPSLQFKRVLNRLTISPSSQAAAAVDRATSEARFIMDATTDLTPFRDNPEAFIQVQHQAVRRKVHALSRVFYRMCDEMEQDGVSLAPLEEFLEDKIRPTISMVSFPRPDYKIFEIMEEFENRGHR